jgi:hypothetical protein
MIRLRIEQTSRIPEIEWMPFPGGELEGSRPRVLCPDCRGRLHRAVASRRPEVVAATLCFQCYRLDLDRTRQLARAAGLDTASEDRFQTTLPFQPVNRSRLARLTREREAARLAARRGIGAYVEKRRRAQIEARNQLGRVLLEIKHRRHGGVQPLGGAPAPEEHRSRMLHADLPLPESWLPFVSAGR